MVDKRVWGSCQGIQDGLVQLTLLELNISQPQQVSPLRSNKWKVSFNTMKKVKKHLKNDDLLFCFLKGADCVDLFHLVSISMCIFTIENPKKLRKFFKKMIKLLLDKQIFASLDARFCRNMHNNGCYTQNFVHNMRNFSLDMILSPQNVPMKPRGGLRSPKGGPPPYT